MAALRAELAVDISARRRRLASLGRQASSTRPPRAALMQQGQSNSWCGASCQLSCESNGGFPHHCARQSKSIPTTLSQTCSVLQTQQCQNQRCRQTRVRAPEQQRASPLGFGTRCSREWRRKPKQPPSGGHASLRATPEDLDAAHWAEARASRRAKRHESEKEAYRKLERIRGAVLPVTSWLVSPRACGTDQSCAAACPLRRCSPHGSCSMGTIRTFLSAHCPGRLSGGQGGHSHCLLKTRP